MLALNVLRAFNSVLILFTLVYVFKKHLLVAKRHRIRNTLPNELGPIFNKNEFPKFFLESFVHLIHFAPFIDHIDGVRENLDVLFIVFSVPAIVKLVQLLELILHFSPLNTSQGRFVGSLSKIQFDAAFLVKTWLKTHPLISLPVSIFFFLIVSSYLLYISERPEFTAVCYSSATDVFYNTFQDKIWLSIVSFLTVGYGDFYPISIVGRIINTITVIGGLITSATVIGLVHEHMQLSNEEMHIYKFIKTRRKEKYRKHIAARLV